MIQEIIEKAAKAGKTIAETVVKVSGELKKAVAEASEDGADGEKKSSAQAKLKESTIALRSSLENIAKSLTQAGGILERLKDDKTDAMAKEAKENGWDIMGILNNDMIGNIEGIDGVIDNTTFRVFSQANPVGENDRDRIWKRFYGGEVDGPSRQLARYVDRITDAYFTNLDAIMIYRLDRFGRGGHHRPFNDEGFPGVRIMETHENYNRQHQDIREEDGIQYGDIIDKVDFNYAARLTAVNAVTMASMAWAPPPPENVMIGGAVRPSTRLRWDAVQDPELAGYKVYWRETTAAQWKYARFVPAGTRDYTLKNIVIDNYLFGVASVNKNGDESVVVYPTTLIPRR